MSVLITGGLGFVGSHIALDLLSNGNHVVCVDNLSNSSITPSFFKTLYGSNFYFHKASTHDAVLLEGILKKYKIKAVVHCAGYKAVGESLVLPGKYYYNNVIGSKILFQTLKKLSIRNLIFSSSATVYGNPVSLPISESHPVRAINPYGQNKIDIENILINDSYFQNNCSVKILRYFNPIGAHTSGLIGERPKGKPNNLMPYILNVAEGKSNKVNVFGGDYDTPDGTGVRDYIHIMDLVEGHIKALNYQTNGISIFNLGTGLGFSVLDLIKMFEQVNHTSIPFEIVSRRFGDIPSVYANTSKAKNILDFQAKYTLQEMCKDVWEFVKKNN